MYEKYRSLQIVKVFDEEQGGIIGEVILFDVEDYQGRDSHYRGVVIEPFTLDGSEFRKGEYAYLHYDNLRPTNEYQY